MSSLWAAPKWIAAFYAKFPLVVLEQEDSIPYEKSERPCLWIHAANSTMRPWAATSPSSLRYQLLFLIRGVHVEFRRWHNEDAVRGGSLPVLQVDHRLLATSEIRSWLDEFYPVDSLVGMNDPAAYDQAVAVAQVVETYLHPALLATLQAQGEAVAPVPPRLALGMNTILPMVLTGSVRTVDDRVITKGIDALEVLDIMTGKGWALGASAPTPLDALITAHLFVISALPGGPLHDRLQGTLTHYLERVLDYAEQQMKHATM